MPPAGCQSEPEVSTAGYTTAGVLSCLQILSMGRRIAPSCAAPCQVGTADRSLPACLALPHAEGSAVGGLPDGFCDMASQSFDVIADPQKRHYEQSSLAGRRRRRRLASAGKGREP